jgi:putative Holliday junction resolvase
MGSHQKVLLIKGFVTHFTNHFPDMKVIRVDERFT